MTGVGEAPSHASAPLIAASADALTGLDPLDIAGLERRVLPSMPGAHSVTDHATRGAWGGVEIAPRDLRGRLWNQPFANVLGGIHRRAIPFTDYVSYRLPQDGRGGEASVAAIVDDCLGLRETHGTAFFGDKVSEPDLRANIALVEALRNALGPDAMLRIDSNQAFSLPSALALAPAFEAPCAGAGIDFWCYSGDPGLGTAAYLHACAAHPRAEPVAAAPAALRRDPRGPGPRRHARSRPPRLRGAAPHGARRARQVPRPSGPRSDAARLAAAASVV